MVQPRRHLPADGPRHALTSQDCLARAIRLDPELADRDRELTIDAKIYRTGLDLSRPLPPGWSFAKLEAVSPAASVGLLAVVMLAIGLARTVGNTGQDSASRWLARIAS